MNIRLKTAQIKSSLAPKVVRWLGSFKLFKTIWIYCRELKRSQPYITMRKVKEEIQCTKNLLLKTWHWSLFLSNPLKVLFSPFLACVFILLEVLANGCCCFASLALLLNTLKCIFWCLALNLKSQSNVRFSWGTQKTSKSPLRLLRLKTKHTQIHHVAQIKSQATYFYVSSVNPSFGGRLKKKKISFQSHHIYMSTTGKVNVRFMMNMRLQRDYIGPTLLQIVSVLYVVQTTHRLATYTDII